MDTYARISAEHAARLVLRLFRMEHPGRYSDATPIDALVYWAGLQVATFHPTDYPEGTFGFIDPDEEEELIWLCRDLAEPLRRFTLAHELGHALMHCGTRLQVLLERYAAQLEQAELAMLQQLTPESSRPDPCNEDDVQIESTLEVDPTQELLPYDPRSQRELAANIFAAELLMPLERVRACYLQERMNIRELATTFGVSSAAMLNRLASLFRPAPVVPAQQQEAPGPATGSKRYDEFQQAAIEAPTPALIVAGPGSGKTSTLVGRVDHIVRALGVPPERILALTFSRKAAQEMEERLHGLLHDVTSTFPKVSTFHAFCADLLRQHGTLVGLSTNFSLIDEVEGYFILRQQARRMRLRHYQSLSAPGLYFPDILKAISRAKDELITPERYAELARSMYEQAIDEETRERAEKTLEVAHVYSLYEEELQRRGDTDFGGLIMRAVQLLRDHPQVRNEQQAQYQHILVDEFQDMNRASGVLLRELAGERRGVWVVGDANQAIYGFRGASPANISQFATDFPGATILPLSRNYRSHPDLVELAEAFRSDRLEPDQLPGKNRPTRQPPPGSCVTLAQASDGEYELAGLIQDIHHKRAGGYAYRDMVVLCRKRALAQRITAALAAEGLPVYERGGIFEQEHTKNLISIILLLTNAGGMGLLRAAHLPDHPIPQEDIEILLRAAHEQKISPRSLLLLGELPFNISIEGRRSLERLAAVLQALLRATDAWSLFMQYLLEESSLVRSLLAEENDKRGIILADYDALLQLTRRYDQQQQRQRRQIEQEAMERGEPAPEPATLEEHLRGFLEYLNLLRQLRQDGSGRQSVDEDAEADPDIIRVMTVHASKGLEFPVVYLPDLVQRSFPLDRRGSRVPVPAGMLPAESEGEAAHHIGEACLFYVGVTRARDHLVLSYSERKNGYTRSPYLEALLGGLAPERVLQRQWDATTLGQLQRAPASASTYTQASAEFV
ncbi:MAG: UvrD-helicase domain-containing protein, partial [Ktedonobacteraceae bacterium]|nr:UvrD-helicase domain-containing protein [Ktedonobacteraceae bacterium]